MILSPLMIKSLLSKLNLKSLNSVFENKAPYLSQLKKEISFLEKKNYNLTLLENKYKLGIKHLRSLKAKEINYIIKIFRKKKGITTANISDSSGKVKQYYLPGKNILKKRMKRNRNIALNKILNKIIYTSKLLPQLRTKIFALHLINVEQYKRVFIYKKLKKRFKIYEIEIFTKIPHNGCRLKKVRRKKFRRKRRKNLRKMKIVVR